MQIEIELKKGKIILNADKVKDIFLSSEDGKYIMSLDKINPLVTVEDYRKAYFSKVDIAGLSTGNDRYTIHKSFKDHYKVESTKDFTPAEWKNFIGTFTWWAYNKLDCIV